MTINQLRQRLIKEFKQNPTKAGVLGALSLVGIWFWAPLLYGWVAPESSQSEVPQTATVASTSSVGVTATAIIPEAEVDATAPGWLELRNRLPHDVRMKTAELPELLVDPFRAGTILNATAHNVEQEDDDSGEQVQDGVEHLTPQQIDLRLTSTIVGQRKRMATINGKSYAEGSVIKAGTTAAAEQESRGRHDERFRSDEEDGLPREDINFKLVRVYADGVVLARHDREYPLPMEKRRLADGEVRRMEAVENQGI